MRLDITGRHVEITPPLRQLIDRRLAKLERLLNDSAISAQVILTKEKYRHRTEIVVHARGDHMLRGDGQGDDVAARVPPGVEKIEQQAQTLKGKWAERKRQGSRTPRRCGRRRQKPAAPAAPRIIRATRYAVKPMSIEDAALRVDARQRDASSCSATPRPTPSASSIGARTATWD